MAQHISRAKFSQVFQTFSEDAVRNSCEWDGKPGSGTTIQHKKPQLYTNYAAHEQMGDNTEWYLPTP